MTTFKIFPKAISTEYFDINLPELQGSQKQIKWGKDIRRVFLDKLHNFDDSDGTKNWSNQEKFVQAIQKMMDLNPTAKTWIEEIQTILNNNSITQLYNKVLQYYVENENSESNKNKGISGKLIGAIKKESGICEITGEKEDGKKINSLRKYRDFKNGEDHAVNFNNDIYMFNFNGNIAENIKWLGNYKLNIWSENTTEEQKKILGEKETTIETTTDSDSEGEIIHEAYNKIFACIDNDIPVYLVGPAGSGKNHTLEQIARKLNLKFYPTNSIQQEHKLTGFIDAGGTYHETEFYKAFTNGGLFFLDEMDASIPEVLVLLNAAIANGYFEFPNGRAEAHIDFRVVAAGNTMGNGADEQYTGRLVLDQATLDRFAIIEFDYDIRIEMKLAKGNIDLVNFIRDLREQSQNLGIRATYSYRCIISATKLNGVLDIVEIVKIAIVKGMDKDTLKTYKIDDSNKYGQALKKLQRAA